MNCSQTDALLDALMDDALTETDRKRLKRHCAGCPACAEKLELTRAMQRMFSKAAPELNVPLKAQAAWRGAIKAEEARKKRRMLTRWAGSLAAALLVAVGGFFTLAKPADNAPANLAADVAAEMAVNAMEYDAAESAEPMDIVEKSVALVEADGESYESISYGASRSMPMLERRMTVEDLDRTCAYMADLVREYEGSLEEQRFEADGVSGANLYIELPAANARDFLTAAAHYDMDDVIEEADEDAGAGEGRVSMLLVLEAKEE